MIVVTIGIVIGRFVLEMWQGFVASLGMTSKKQHPLRGYPLATLGMTSNELFQIWNEGRAMLLHARTRVDRVGARAVRQADRSEPDHHAEQCVDHSLAI